MSTKQALFSQTVHRPWPLPSLPWIMFQQWSDLLFAHWALDPAVVLPLVPPELELDLFDGKAWVAITPFRMTDIHLRGLPTIPGTGPFLEMNLRTYVRLGAGGPARPHPTPGNDAPDGHAKPGVFFFSLDASNLPAVLGARLGFGLPYYWSNMSAHHQHGEIHYRSARKQGDARVDVRYGPAGEVITAKSRLERFLTERYCLYEVRMGVTLRTEIHHAPWPLQTAHATFNTNTLGAAHHLPLSLTPDWVHFSKQLDVAVYPPVPALDEIAAV